MLIKTYINKNPNVNYEEYINLPVYDKSPINGVDINEVKLLGKVRDIKIIDDKVMLIIELNTKSHELTWCHLRLNGDKVEPLWLSFDFIEDEF